MKKVIHYVVLSLFLLSGIYIAVLLNTPPRVPVQARPQDYSVKNEIKHINALAQKPHPAGAQEHDRVRDYIFNTLEELDLNPEIQKTMSVSKMRWGG